MADVGLEGRLARLERLREEPAQDAHLGRAPLFTREAADQPDRVGAAPIIIFRRVVLGGALRSRVGEREEASRQARHGEREVEHFRNQRGELARAAEEVDHLVEALQVVVLGEQSLGAIDLADVADLAGLALDPLAELVERFVIGGRRGRGGLGDRGDAAGSPALDRALEFSRDPS